MEKVVILIPIYKPTISYYESISLRQCCRVLGKHPIVFVTPRNLDTTSHQIICQEENTSTTIEYFDNKYFRKTQTYSQLLMGLEFYKRFSVYEYMLIYQLDAFVFKDDLLTWCNKNYSYIGAPWLAFKDMPNQSEHFYGVGNGGFSLRNVQDCLRVVQSFSAIYFLSDFSWYKKYASGNMLQKTFKFLFHLLVGNTTHHLFRHYSDSEDMFWGIYVGRNKRNNFKIPLAEEAMYFSLELKPRYLYNEYLKNELPFGCHAWWQYDLDFWKEHIRTFGYTI